MSSPEHAGALATVSKRAAIASLLGISALQLVLPDVSWTLRAMGIVAFCLGWILARSGSGLTLWLLLAPLAPALAFFLARRQGPAIDVLWMLGLSGALLRTMSWSQWTLPAPRKGAPYDIWTVLLGGWALVLSLTWPIVVWREAAFELGTLRDMDAINSWAMVPAPQAIGWTLYVVQAQLLALFWFERVSGMFAPPAPSASPAPPAFRLPRVAHALWAALTVASVVAVFQGIVDIAFLNPEFWASRQRATGTMLDANAYGTAAALAGPIGFLALLGAGRWGYLAGSAVLAVNFAGVWVSGSRTAALCALVGSAGLAIGLWRARDEAPARRALTLLGAGGVLALVIAVTAEIGPLRRTDGDAVSASAEGLSALVNRGGYGTIAMRMIREYPLTGVGPGAYRYLAPDYWRAIADDRLELDNAQNWWRHQAAELGLPGAASVLLWSLLVAWCVITARARPTQSVQAWTVRGLLAGLGAISLVGMPTQNPLVLLWFFFLVAWLTAATGTPAHVPLARRHWIARGWIGVAVLAMTAAVGQVILARGPLSVSDRAVRFHRPYVEGAYAPERAPDSGEFHWTDDESRFVLPVRGKALVIRLWAHHPDIGQQPVAVAIEGPCGLLFRQELRSPSPISVGMAVPDDVEIVEAVVRVSRTWQPADAGGGDTRTLGVAVETDFVESPEAAGSQDYRMDWGECPAGR